MENVCVQRRQSKRWISEVKQLTHRPSTLTKRSTIEVTPGRRPSMTSRSQNNRRMSFADVITPRLASTARLDTPVHPRMSQVSTNIVLVEKVRDHVISTKLRRQKSDLEQEIKLAQIKRRRFTHNNRNNDDVNDKNDVMNVQLLDVSTCKNKYPRMSHFYSIIVHR